MCSQASAMELGIHEKCMMCDGLGFLKNFFFFGGGWRGDREEQMLGSLPLIVATLVSL